MLTTNPRLGELIMIRRLAIEEDETQSTADTDSVTESFDKLDIDSTTSATSSSKHSSSRSPSRASSSGTGESYSSSLGGLTSHLPSILNPHHHSHHSHSHKRSGSHADGEKKRNDHLARWLTSGNVIYKSVGLGLMDLVVGFRLIELANAKNVGGRVEDFSPKSGSG
ncbi:hypothetical protein NPX13_g2376 [Xylaria arbuscula]|uniref:Uncharacterized protein n=1 Tax=Xylaria arbuscula TaxID=114810 RepID=A0A9W8NKB4_9PEZI|nr:hypothetical protein NPX13_g2376 [Xylaria arbuscula]